uniref:Uncharacterized protein n=1 Tax=Ditylenchus dipsaci TaxID=166011 RepID=A0A915EDQ8_9BILA
MASGARPSSNQRAENATSAETGGGRKQRAGAHGPASDFCVVCGDRACSHHYYGVAACHGCKCFFWRSVNNNSNMYAAMTRCLDAGMQVDAVRMQKPTDGQLPAPAQTTNPTSTTKLVLCAKRPFHPPPILEAFGQTNTSLPDELNPFLQPLAYVESNKQSEDESAQQILDQTLNKKARQDNNQLIQQLICLEEKANEEADFSENEAPKRRISLNEIFFCPEYFECYRTRVNYCVRLRKVTVEEMEFCKYRTLAKAYDYINAMENMDKASQDAFAVEDKIILLKNGFAPLTLFDIACGTLQATKDSNLLCLPTGITVSRNEKIISNSFISQKIIDNIVDILNRSLSELALDSEEMTMLRVIVLLNADANTDKKMSKSADQFVRDLKDRVHAALYQHCTDAQPTRDATLRFAKLLHILPKLTLLARDLLEHIRMVHTFTADSKAIDPIFFQLFGDIFQGEQEASGSSVLEASEQSPPGIVNCKIESPQPISHRNHLEEKS